MRATFMLKGKDEATIQANSAFILAIDEGPGSENPTIGSLWTRDFASFETHQIGAI
jgi:hypothetical protein